MTFYLDLEGIWPGTKLGDGHFREGTGDTEGESSEWMLSGEGQLGVLLGKKLRLTEKGLECLAKGFRLHW